MFFEHVELFELGAHVSFVLLVVSGDLRFPLLEHFDFEATLARPLLPQVFVELLNRFVL